jgi:hypothetical protein
LQDDMVDQVRRSLRHAPGHARRARTALPAAEGQQPVVPAVAAAQAQESVNQHAAFGGGIELVLHELRQVGAGRGLGLFEECRGVLLRGVIRRGLSQAAALAVDRSAIRHRLDLPAIGLLAMLPRL